MTSLAHKTLPPAGGAPVILLGLLAGLDLRPSKRLVAEATRLGCARGLAQIFSSGVSAAGVTCFILLHQEHAVWSWPLYMLCAGLMLVFDSIFNLVLNLLAGWRYASLLIIRIGLTVILGYFTANTLTLLGNQQAVIPMAEELAGEAVDLRIKPYFDRVDIAKNAWVDLQSAQVDYESKLATVPMADTPSACEQSAVLSDDPLGRRAQNMRLKACAQSMAALEAARKQAASAQEALRAQLKAAATDAEEALKSARANLKVELEKKPETTAALAGNIGFQMAAIKQLNETDPQAKLMYWALIAVIFVVEFAALLFKIFTATMDPAALRQREELLEACVTHSIGICSAQFMHQVGHQFRRNESLLKHAREIYSDDVKSSVTAHAATRRAKETYDKLVADLEKEPV